MPSTQASPRVSINALVRGRSTRPKYRACGGERVVGFELALFVPTQSSPIVNDIRSVPVSYLEASK
ncbi:MAG TPA: hypothetical protein V6C91_11705, partial [Coleofasciculaceae cyanobacterium]